MNNGERYSLTENLQDEEPQEALSLEIPTLVRHTARDVLLAHATLLDNVVVAQQIDQEAFRLVKASIQVLEKWHEQHTGWRVQHRPTFFRLERHLHTVLP